MYARVASATGWTFEYIGQCLTLPRLNSLYAHWRDYPPMAEAYAVVHGFGDARSDAAPGAANAPKFIDNAAIVADMHADPRTLNWRSAPNG